MSATGSIRWSATCKNAPAPHERAVDEPVSASDARKLSGVYTFTRDPKSLIGFLSDSSAATDASFTAQQWAERGDGRAYELLQHEPASDLLVICLTLEGAVPNARDDLNALCEEFGLARTRVA